MNHLSDPRNHRSSGLTVIELARAYLEHCRRRLPRKSLLFRRRWLEKFVQSHGDRPARAITALDADRFRRDSASRPALPGGTYKPSTLNKAMAVLKACWQWAFMEGLLPPAVKPFRIRPLDHCVPRRAITSAEFQALLRACREAAMRRLLLALRFTGARVRELLLLTWERVDWRHHCFLVINRRRLVRPVYFPPVCERLLRWCQRVYGTNSPLVFLASNGEPWSRRAIERRMGCLRRRAKIGVDAHGAVLTLHSFRHAFINACFIAVGLASPIPGAMLGRVMDETSRLLAIGPSAESLAEAVRLIADILRPSR
jgi:integrase